MINFLKENFYMFMILALFLLGVGIAIMLELLMLLADKITHHNKERGKIATYGESEEQTE